MRTVKSVGWVIGKTQLNAGIKRKRIPLGPCPICSNQDWKKHYWHDENQVICSICGTGIQLGGLDRPPKYNRQLDWQMLLIADKFIREQDFGKRSKW
jgi:Zn ribbon nucleic-acid-binding protein